MSALRRDLVERRLWPLVAMLIAAVVAVPLLLLDRAPASGAGVPAPPNLVFPVQTADRGAAAKTARILARALPRDPFASGMPKLTAKPAAPLRSASTSSTTGTHATLVAPAPAAASSQSPVTTSTAAASPPGNSAAATTTTTTTSSDPASTRPVATAPSTQSWTIYAVDLRFGRDGRAPVRRDLTRLTLLPSARQPDLMFMGVMAGGREAVFALAAGVHRFGPGVCKPSRLVCSAIVLGAGQTELITGAGARGASPPLLLGLVAVRSRVTRSQPTAMAAYNRRSAAGQCDLDLAEPMSYGPSQGTLSAAAGGSCRHQRMAVPFPSAAQSQ